MRAAEEAAAVLAPAETLRHLTTALKLWERVPDPADVTGTHRAELMLQAAAAAHATGNLPRAVGLAEDAAAVAEHRANPAWAARAYERLGMYLQYAGRVEDALRARARAVELVPAAPPSRLRARVTAAMAQALININDAREDEARHWCEETVAVARAVDSAEDEADALITLGITEAQEDPASTRRLYAAARARAADAGNHEIEARALWDLAILELGLGNLSAARAAFDEGAELADRTGFGWSWWGIAMCSMQLSVRYEAGEWDDCERLAAAVPYLAPPLAIASLGAAALWVEVGRGRTTVPKRLRGPTALTALNATTDVEVEVAGLEADHAIWQGDLDRAMSAVRHALATIDARETRAFHDDVWISAVGLAVQAERAERVRAAGDAAALNDAKAVGQGLLERVREAIEQAQRVGLAHEVRLRGFHAKAEAEWTRLQGNSNPEVWQAAVEAFSWGHVYEVARCRWRLAEALLGAGDREQATVAAQAAHQTAIRLGAEPLQAALELLARRGRLDLGAGVPAERGLAGLTPRELEVLRLLVEGRSNRQIAEQLFISGKTASVHVTRILAKLDVHSRRDAAARARQLGLDQELDHGQS